MKDILERIFFLKNDKIICIDANECSFSKIPNLIKEYIIESIHKNEKVIVITDNLEYREIIDVFFNIQLYNPVSINIDKLIELVNENNDNTENIRIIWDFKTISKGKDNIDKLNNYIDIFLKKLNMSNIIHMVYINNLNCEEKQLLKLVKKFQGLLIVNSERDLYFQVENEIEKIVYLMYWNQYNQNKYLSLENKLIKIEKLKLMIETTAGVAHDMNNILTPIIGTIQLLKDMDIKNKNILEYIKTLEMCANDGMRITNKMKTINTIEDDIEEMSIFNVDDLIVDAINLTKDKWFTQNTLNGIKTKVITALNSKALIKGNSTEIREVFINLIINAIDALENGGNINICTNRIGNNVKIEICDNGIGIPKENLEKIFDPFFTTKGDNGSGLGLVISKKIIATHEGTVSVESKVNKGTKFIIMLPICKTEKYNIKKVKKDQVVNFSGDILIIDDQYQIRNVIADMIKSMTKCRIKKCDSENLLLELGRRKYNIIICDLCMPKIDGLEVGEFAKDKNKDCYFCLMTGWMGNFDKNQCVDFVLNKPINKDKIIDMFVDYNIKYN